MVDEAWKNTNELMHDLSEKYGFDDPLACLTKYEPYFDHDVLIKCLFGYLKDRGIKLEAILNVVNNEMFRKLFTGATQEEREDLWTCARTLCLIYQTQ